MPTFAEAAGLPAPARTDGVSLMPTLTGQGKQAAPTVYVEYFEPGRTPKFAQFEPGHRERIRRQMQALRLGDFIGVRYDIARQSDDFESTTPSPIPRRRTTWPAIRSSRRSSSSSRTGRCNCVGPAEA